MGATEPGMDEVFKALADPSRRELLDRLNHRNGQTLRELVEGLGMARQSVSKHLAILEAADLVTTQRRGREKLHFLNAAPITAIGDRWIHTYHQPRAQALADLKTALEQHAMSTNPSTFSYTTYIASTPEQVWAGLTDPAFTRRYWNLAFETDWEKGSPMVWENHGVRIEDPEQVVLEADPYTRLAYTWHTMTPELATAIGWDEAKADAWNAEGRSRVAFDISMFGGKVKLEVTHECVDADGVVISAIGGGWPVVISNLKTLLETGEVLPDLDD